jgi:hypothetical protein
MEEVMIEGKDEGAERKERTKRGRGKGAWGVGKEEVEGKKEGG